MSQAAPISRLPAELLSEIFLYNRDSSIVNFLDGTESHPHTWTAVTHVCRVWRSVALSFPHLWDHIYTSRKDVAVAWLSRSHELPLQVRTTTDPGSSLASTLLKELPRITSLHMDLPTPDTLLDDISWKNLAANRLRDLHISTAYTPVSPRPRFCKPLPALRSLFFADRCTRWTDFNLPALEALEIRGRRWYDAQQGGHQALQCLGRSPLLQTLVIHDANNIPGSDQNNDLPAALNSSPALPKVSLPRMQHMHIQGTPFVCLHLLKHLILPESATLHLQLHTNDWVPRTVEAWVRLLNALIFAPRAPFLPVRTMSIGVFRDRTLEVRCWRDAGLGDALQLVPADIVVELDICKAAYGGFRDFEWFSWAMAFYAVVGGLQLSTLEVLNIGQLHETAEAMDFRRVLARMPNIHTLSVAGWTLSELLALVPTRRALEGPAEELFLPHLRHLHLQEVHFPVRPAGSEGRLSMLYWTDRLLVRWERGVGLQTIVLRRCYNVWEGLVDNMGQYVKSVEWDGLKLLDDFLDQRDGPDLADVQ